MLLIASVLPLSLLPLPLLLFLLLPLPLLLLLLPLEEFLLYASFFPLDSYVEGVSSLVYVFLASLFLREVVVCLAKVLPSPLNLIILLLL